MKTKTIQQLEETTECPECSSKDLNKDNYRAELVCNNCGLVIDEELIDYSPEWRGFDSEQWKKRSRVGPPMTPLIHDKGLTTAIEWKNKDSYGKSIPHKNRAQIYRLRKWQKRIRTYRGRERNLVQALSSLDRMASAMALPRTVRETAAIIYRKAAAKNIVRGRKIEGLVAASLYAACRQCHVPRTLDEISNKSNISRKEIGRDYRYLAHELGLKLLSTTPQDYISRFCSELGLSINVQAKTLEILKELDRKLTSGLSPTGIAAAAIYIGALLVGEKRTQREIAEKVGITEVTIRNRYKDLAEKLDIDITL